MKVAFTTTGTDLEAPLDPRFGRSPFFVVCDAESGAIEVIDNEKNLNASQGAGVQAAGSVVRSGAECVITGHCGPNAFRVLSMAGVRIYLTDAPTIGEALDRFRAGSLQALTQADVEGHWA
ncbi:MAG: NifB/NifX family molybdenum-iron cluster-binding protein [Deltaproteobacteria bacterium]|nr:NifB/NifX family molybdenum-iron cluster-binding protein [Deltaproteobacteria bacterium]